MSILNPQANLVIWNFNERMVPPDGATTNVMNVSETIVPTNSIVSIFTSRGKAQPGGAFDIELAPTQNWISAITVGSWIAVLMSAKKKIRTDGAQQATLKMIGRIDSVRVVCRVNPSTGARMTSYLVTGSDWTSVFNNQVYIDSLAVPEPGKSGVPTGVAAFMEIIRSKVEDKAVFFPSTTTMTQAIIDMYGRFGSLRPSKFVADAQKIVSDNIKVAPQAIFHLPTEVVKFLGGVEDQQSEPDGILPTSQSLSSLRKKIMGNIDPFGDGSKAITEYIEVVSGKLTNYDTYEDAVESRTYVSAFSFIGQKSFWEVLIEHTNPILNELIPEIRWSGNKPQLTLYKRVKPFMVSADLSGGSFLSYGGKSLVTSLPPLAAVAKTGVNLDTANSNLKSKFKHVKKVMIELNDVISANAGTNWNNRINMIEILPNVKELEKLDLQGLTKQSGQVIDDYAAQREGLKPMLLRSNWYAVDDGNTFSANAFAVVAWKYILQEWYFNLHNLLDGSLEIIGQDQYIAVGDNVLVPAKVLGPTPNFFKDLTPKQAENIYLLAHIEGIQHKFAVDDNGARIYTSVIQFSRGMLTNKDGDLYPSWLGGSGDLSAPANIQSGEAAPHNNVVGKV